MSTTSISTICTYKYTKPREMLQLNLTDYRSNGWGNTYVATFFSSRILNRKKNLARLHLIPLKEGLFREFDAQAKGKPTPTEFWMWRGSSWMIFCTILDITYSGMHPSTSLYWRLCNIYIKKDYIIKHIYIYMCIWIFFFGYGDFLLDNLTRKLKHWTQKDKDKTWSIEH